MPVIKHFPNFFSQTDSYTLQNIQTVTDYLTQNYHAKCYIVGGAVRDRLLGCECKDYDIECFGISIEDFESAMNYLGAYGAGKSFFVYKYKNLDISLPRREQKVGRGHQGFEVTLTSDEREASKRRDFTVNALMYDIQNKQILDFWYGLDDLEDKRLRVVNRDSFVEDSLRVLRAMQFATRLGFKVEKESCRLCRSMVLDDLPKERIFLEFEKMFKGRYLHYGLYYLFSLGIAEKLFGERIDKSLFIEWSRALQKSQKNFIERLRPYYFLFIAREYLSTDIEQIMDTLGVPKIYRRKVLSNILPDRVDCAFVVRMALKEGIIEYVGNYHPKVVRIAKYLDVWEKPFRSGIVAKELIKEGFRGKELGREIKRRVEEKIKGLNEDCS